MAVSGLADWPYLLRSQLKAVVEKLIGKCGSDNGNNRKSGNNSNGPHSNVSLV
jgi:hypothetical protein